MNSACQRDFLIPEHCDHALWAADEYRRPQIEVATRCSQAATGPRRPEAHCTQGIRVSISKVQGARITVVPKRTVLSSEYTPIMVFLWYVNR